MNLKTITNEMREALRAPLPKGAVGKHPAKTYLSSIKGIYVVERLNDVFGIGGWTQKVERESVNDKGMVVVKLTLEIPSYGIYFESYGGNDNGGNGNKNFDLGDAFKGATTDAFTKVCSFLEIGIDVFKGQADAGQLKPTVKKPDAQAIQKALEALINDIKNTKSLAALTALKARVEKARKALTEDQSSTLDEHLQVKYDELKEGGAR